MKRIFKIEIIVTASTEENLEDMMEFKENVERGYAQADFMEDGFEDVVITFTELENNLEKDE